MCARFCLCPPRLMSLFPPVLWKSYNLIPLTFKVRFSGNSLSFVGSSDWEAWQVVQNLRNSGRTFLVLSFSSFVGHQSGLYEILIYCDCAPPTVSLWLLFCLWPWGLFLMGSWVLLSMVVQQLVVILVLLQEEISTRLSTLPFLVYFRFFKKIISYYQEQY